MADNVREFFNQVEQVWEAIPSYVKVFLYSSVSTTFGLWVAGELNFTAVIIVVMTNLGLYQAPRKINMMVK